MHTPTEGRDLWVPYPMAGAETNFNTGDMNTVSRLASGASLAQAQAQLTMISKKLSANIQNSWANASIKLRELRSDELSGVRPFVLVVEVMVLLVLLIASANTANLALARVIGRERELALRTALGAGRGRIARTLLTESLVLALAGGAIGILLATVGVPLIRAHALGEYFSRAVAGWTEIAVNGRVVLFTVVVSIATGIVFGTFPLLHASKLDLTTSLKDGGRSSTAGASDRRVRTALVVGQFIVAFVLTVGASLLARSLTALVHTDPGFQADHVLALDIGIPQGSYVNDSAIKAVNVEVVNSVEALPDVRAAALTSFLPMGHAYNTTTFTVAGQSQESITDRDKPEALEHAVTSGYFGTLRVRLLRGRVWPPNTVGDTTRFIVVNQTLATRYFHGIDPIGGVLNLGWGSARIVGVVSDTKATGVDNKQVEPEVYELMEQQARSSYQLVARVAGDPAPAARVIRNRLASLDPNIAVGRIRTLNDVVTDYLSPWLLMVIPIGGFAVTAIVIAGIGI